MFTYSIPFSQPKNLGFNFFPPGTIKQYDARKWALYYVPSMNMSFIVIDFSDRWKINHYVGKMQLRYVQDVMASKPCCNQEN
jgi:hypothetical protein